MRVFDILQYFSDFYENFNIVKAREMLKALDLHEDMRLKTMSKGTKEKVQLILVMSRDADLYLPVSYTHLDVYKRQEPNSRILLFPKTPAFFRSDLQSR